MGIAVNFSCFAFIFTMFRGSGFQNRPGGCGYGSGTEPGASCSEQRCSSCSLPRSKSCITTAQTLIAENRASGGRSNTNTLNSRIYFYAATVPASCETRIVVMKLIKAAADNEMVMSLMEAV